MKKMTLSLGCILTLLILAMIALCLFQSPSFDDYVPVYLKKEFGQFGSIHWYLTKCNGRYSTIPFFLLIAASNNFVALYPYLLIFFILFSILAIYWFLDTISRNMFTGTLQRGQLLLLSAILTFTFLAVIPEVASYYYWFATSITYLFPFSLFLLYLAAWCSFFTKEKKWKYAMILFLLGLLLGGCNEVMMYFVFAIPFLIAAIMVSMQQKIPAPVFLVLAGAILMAIIVLNMPGNGTRTNHYESTQSIFTSFTGSVFRTFKFFLLLFSNPLFYISCAGVIVACSFIRQDIKGYFSKKKSNWLLEILILFALVFGFDLVIRQLANYVVPPRATNILVCISLLGWWWIIIMNAYRFSALLNWLQIHHNKARLYFCNLFILGLLGSNYFMQLVSNIITLPTHDIVLKQRVKIIRDAKDSGRNTAYIPSYHKEVEKELERKFKGKSRFVKDEFPFPPSFAYFKDEPYSKEDAYFYAEYYGIDSIATDTARYARWGLTNIFPNDQPVK
ncbi:DUF6056 family protein [Pseudobacter ginsenosidimutans]|uniref:4-amino-4-deoxy-L-arabinose transferase-like glycosyltransferase n=1 Tax=Pseudobacter ginsenosidimutans TaxID=661488 RepID=A0A4Q7MKK6_9BACT|nr:DUF6056 family protein [Pseudobacter ginsenosidimutans]QEC40523.1 hypothetical protein FSB84_01960 [Pseudobacter ginsenosidimutans]RZS68865.1 hypothetical protein EV199_4689 [Pseudobacter ginsenosidimutans]